MKRAVLLFVILLASASPFAQQPPTAPAAIDPGAVPVEQEPRHRLVFANDFVRIIDAVFPPGYVSQPHTHFYDNVAVIIQSGRDDAQGQSRVGFAGFSRGSYTHVVTNPTAGQMRFIAVELRAPEKGAGDETPQPSHTTVLSNSKVRISRVRLDAGQSVSDHQHPGGYVSIVVRGTEGAGAWRWHPAGEAASTLDAGKNALELVEVEPK
jgi:quercetin dioxygenase-like cupin family protein